MVKDELIKSALKAMEKAYAPYSRFSVGAALLCKNGNIYTGFNIENSSYSATLCAERSAFVNALTNGERDFVGVAIVGSDGKNEKPCPPCGVCRQFMTEFCNSDFKIYLQDGCTIKEFTLGKMLPYSFRLEG